MTTLQIAYNSEPRDAAELVARYRDVKRRLNPPKIRILIQAAPIKTPIGNGPEKAEPIGIVPRFEREIEASCNRFSSKRAEAALEMVVERTGFAIGDIMSRRRLAPIVAARQEAMWVVKIATDWSLPRLGRFFNGRDHTTVLHSLRKMEKRAERDPELGAYMTEIKRICA